MFEIPSVTTHYFASRIVDQMFKITVSQPLMDPKDNKNFPVVFMSDANMAFSACREISHSLQICGDVHRYILVGIGYPSANPWGGEYLRGRDLAASDYPVSLSEMPDIPIKGVLKPSGLKKWGHAEDFRKFIHDELFPFVMNKYPIDDNHRSYFGHSMGGYFGLNVLFNQPELFGRYIISSPGLLRDDKGAIFEEAKQFLLAPIKQKKLIYLSSGNQEEDEPNFSRFKTVSNTKKLASMLSDDSSGKLKVIYENFLGETHLSVWPMAFSRGVRALLGRPDKPPIS